MNKENENEFDRFVKKNLAILSPIFDSLGDSKPTKNDTLSNGWISKAIDNMQPLQRVLYFAKKNGKCLIEAERMYYESLEKSQEYGKLILGNSAPKQPLFLQKQFKQLMDFDEAKKKFWNIYLKDSLYPDKFEIDENNKEEITQLVKYFIQDPTCKLNLKKGIALVGGVGTGKTNLMNQFSYFCKDSKFENAFEMKDTKEYINEVEAFGMASENKYFNANYCFDDIATGNTEVTHFGTKINPLDDLIHGGYRRFTKKVSNPTHYTMNIDFDPELESERLKLIATFNIRWIDRIRQMCNFVYLGGQSRRK